VPARSRTPKPCTFCAIIRGELAAEIVVDEPHVVGFLDSHPLFFGHVLLVPREHVETLPDLPAEEIAPLFTSIQRMARAVKDSMEADGTMVLNNNVVSQSVPHLHVHVIPRKRGDGLRFWLGPRRKYADDNEAAAYGARIKQAYDERPG
jgi:histidine triad (HIT) family protein